MFVSHTIAFVLRVAFLFFSILGMARLVLHRDSDGMRNHILVLASLACLFVSGAIVAPDASQAVWLLLAFVVLAACDLVFATMRGEVRNLLLPVALLGGMGAAISFDTIPEGATKHVTILLVSMALCVMVAFVARRFLDLLAATFVVLMVFSIAMCALPLVPGLGKTENGAQMSISIGSSNAQDSDEGGAGPSGEHGTGESNSLGLQTKELAKVTLALALAGYLAANARRVRTLSLRGLVPIVIALLLSLGLAVKTNDLGSGIVIFALFVAMLSLCSGRAGVLYFLLLVAAIALLVAVAIHAKPHIAARFTVWLDHDFDLSGVGYQAAKARETMANGGLVGTGLHFGPKLGALPECYNDYVFAAIVEELGVLGGMSVILAILGIAVESLRIVRTLSWGSFERNMVLGSCCLLCWQSFVIIGGVTGVIPLTGITLPFVSTGGSSLLGCSLMLGLMAACAAHADYGDSYGGPTAGTRLLTVSIVVAMAACAFNVVMLQPAIRICGNTNAAYSASEVVTSDGVELARGGSLEGSGAVGREYPQGTMAVHVLGLSSDGIERLLCNTDARSNNPILNALALPQKMPQTTLTLDSSIQVEAESQLQGVTGATVVLDVKTRAVLAEASSPTYDPATGGDASEDGRYVNRATGSLYAPGSTFKTVTLAAALESKEATLNSVYTGDPFTLGENQKVTNDRDARYGDITLKEALCVSANTAFAKLALKMGEEPIAKMASALGFDHDAADPALNAKTSSYGPCTDKYTQAWAAVGLAMKSGEKTTGPEATVLQMCSVMATIADDGVMRQPYLVESGPIVSPRSEPTQAMSPQTAHEVWDAMVAASGVDWDGVEVAGKTGTAQSGDGCLCWYICSDCNVAVTTCVEGTKDDRGSTLAKPRALAVLSAAAKR
ncbi:MAG: FtsW/RodA/SpoVE family cell cycle protein [Coriobacteriales bacterium]|nr:FtsW/RodA/SpoVE family cell cycle protein [Coriobacteriales bacterium]